MNDGRVGSEREAKSGGGSKRGMMTSSTLKVLRFSWPHNRNGFSFQQVSHQKCDKILRKDLSNPMISRFATTAISSDAV